MLRVILELILQLQAIALQGHSIDLEGAVQSKRTEAIQFIRSNTSHSHDSLTLQTAHKRGLIPLTTSPGRQGSILNMGKLRNKGK